MTRRARRTSAKRTRAASRAKRTYFFGAGRADGNAKQKNLLGGKGANLAEMTRLGVPVPAGFTIPTEVCTEFYALGRRLPEGLDDEVRTQLAKVERAMGGSFGSYERPLLVSVRSGARASMPGMMDTVLNLGLNDDTVKGLIAESGDRRFAFDTYRRFIHMYGDVVLGVKHELFESRLDELKKSRRVRHSAVSS